MAHCSLRFSLLVALAVGLASPAALAQGSDDADAAATTARAQYNAGTKAFNEQRYGEAALAFEAAADAKPSPVALYTAALSWERTNTPDRAADDYARALALPGLPADKLSLAKERLAQLDGMLGAVSVTGPDGVRVQLDASSERPVPATLHGTVGIHTLAVRSASGDIERRPVTLERGKTTPVDLAAPVVAPAVAAPPPPEPTPPPAPQAAPAPRDWKKTAGIATVGVGGATLLAGVLLGFEAVDAKNAYVAAPAQATYDHASALQTWTNVAFVAGGVLTAGGVALLLWPSQKAPELPHTDVTLLPGGVAVRGTF